MKRTAAIFSSVFLFLSLTLHAQVSDSVLFREAQRRFQNGDYELSYSLFTRYLQEYPSSRNAAEAALTRVIIDYNRGKYGEAYQKIVSLESAPYRAALAEILPFWKGCTQYQLANWEDASENLGNFLLTEGSGGYEGAYVEKALLFRGLAQLKLEETAAAAETLGRAAGVLSDPKEQAFASVTYLDALLKLGRYQVVLDYINSDLALAELGMYEKYRDLYWAEAYWNLGDIESAKVIYREMVAADLEGPVSVVPFKRLFFIYQQQDDFDKIGELVDQAEIRLVQHPEIVSEFRSILGALHFRSGKIDLAEAYLSRAWRSREQTGVLDIVPVYLAEISRQRQDLTGAVEILQTYFREGGEETGLSQAKLGSLYMQTEKWEKAAEMYQKNVAAFPGAAEYGDWIYHLGYSLLKIEDYAAAEEYVQVYLNMKKGDGQNEEQELKLQRLLSIIEKELHRYDAALASLQQYVPKRPGDIAARYDLLRLYFQQGKYATVISEAERFFDSRPDFETEEPRMYVLFRYLHGLALIPGKEYGRAAGILSIIEETSEKYTPEIHPYVLFYLGWSRYRNAQYAEGLSAYKAFLDTYPDHPLSVRSYYTAGWCAYTMEEYRQAAELFQPFFGEEFSPEERARGILMFGKSSAFLEQFEDAAFAFQFVGKEFGESEYADDALYEYAEVLQMQGKNSLSIDAYLQVFTRYPDSPLAEDAMYKRGDLLYRSGDYIPSRNAFYEYRASFPSGVLIDAALYWGGMAFKFSDEPFGAVLLWERLIETYTRSSFRPDALAETAGIYMESGNLEKSLELYNQLILQYPVEAESVRAEIQREKLKNMIRGMSGREAELNALITREGTGSGSGREAILELSKIYIYRGTKKETELKQAKLMLEMLLEKRTADPEAAAKATYLLGEYYYRMEDLSSAAKSFVEAATMYPRDRDFMAQALFRAAEITKQAGNLNETKALAQRMEKSFPESQWSLEVQKLLGGTR